MADAVYRGLTGVYWTTPRQAPPGGTFRMEYVHGTSYCSPEEMEDILREVSGDFLGPTYNILTRNCNHFTSKLCLKLTGQPAPAWINRAAGIGVALPCVVPQAWVAPPECEEETMLVEEDLEDFHHQHLDRNGWEDYNEDLFNQAQTGVSRDRAPRVTDEAGRLLARGERAKMSTVL